MNLKYIRKRMAVLGLSAVFTMTGLTGCGNQTKLVFTTGLSGNQVFKIGTETCTMPEIMIYLTTFYNQYAEIYGKEMWNYDFGGVSLEEHVKDEVLSKLAQIKIMNLMAEERGITLSEEEEQRVSKAAEVYYETLSEELKKQEDITKEIVQKVYEEYAAANKVYANITEAADMEISDDEARTVTVQKIYFQNEDRGKQILERIQSGEAFEAIAAEVSEDKQLVQSYARGTVETAFEEVLFSMDAGEISDVIKTSDGFYIVKSISTIDYEATQENKLVLADKRKKEAFSQAYTEIAKNTHSQFRDKQWEKLTLREEIYETEANFFEIYEEYVKQ